MPPILMASGAAAVAAFWAWAQRTANRYSTSARGFITATFVDLRPGLGGLLLAFHLYGHHAVVHADRIRVHPDGHVRLQDFAAVHTDLVAVQGTGDRRTGHDAVAQGT